MTENYFANEAAKADERHRDMEAGRPAEGAVAAVPSPFPSPASAHPSGAPSRGTGRASGRRTRPKLQTTLDPSVMAEMRAWCGANGRTLSWLVEDMWKGCRGRYGF